MLQVSAIYTALVAAALAAGNPVLSRAVDKLNDGAFKEAQQRDDTATRAHANAQIKTSDGRCLFVDALSGDFRANLTPLQIADCGGNQTGQGFDVITKGKHNDQQGQALVVSSLTQACLSFDPRRPADSQVHLFSCGGRADGGGEVSNSQLFAFDGEEQGAISLKPQNSPGKCLALAGTKVVIGDCDDKDVKQKFTFGGDAGKGNGGNSNKGASGSKQPVPSSSAARDTTSTATKPPKSQLTSASLPLKSLVSGDVDSKCSLNVVTVVNTVTVTMPPPEGMGGATNVLYSTIFPTETGSPRRKGAKNKNSSVCSDGGSTKNGGSNNNGDSKSTGGSNKNGGSIIGGCTGGNAANTSATNIGADTTTTTTRAVNGQHTANPTTEVPVSRAGTKLNPTAAAPANQFDTTARRALESVNLRAADGRCLAINPTAGDFRQNLIPVGFAECSEDSTQKFDVVTQGKHNDAKDGKALLVSVLTNGCLSFDSRRQQGDTVTVFSCGGRADGEGQTATSQLFPFDGTNNIVLQPSSDDGKFCLVAGKDRLDSTSCDKQKDQIFELVEVLKSTADRLQANKLDRPPDSGEWGRSTGSRTAQPQPDLRHFADPSNYRHTTAALASCLPLTRTMATPVAVAAFAAVGVPLVTAALILVPRLGLFRATGQPHAVLPKPVSRLDGRDVLTIILLILAKLLQRVFGLAPPLVPSADRRGFDLPALSVTSTLAIDEDDLLRFDAATSPGSKKASSAKAQSNSAAENNRSLLIAGLVNPLMSILLANRNLPIHPFGAVNTRNTFTFLDPEACRYPTQVLDPTRGITVSASLGGPSNPGRRVKRGIEFEIYFEVAALRRGDTSPTVIFKQVGAVLAHLPRDTKPLYRDLSSTLAVDGAGEEEDEKEPAWMSADGEIVELGMRAPKKWAALCRDYNPIHISSILARAFGFPGKIAHGNHALARAVELIARDPPRVMTPGLSTADKASLLLSRSDDGKETPSALEVHFKRPMVLPSRLGLEVADVKSGFALRVVKNEKEHLTAMWTKL
ncbi:Ricin B lectin [Akanthomyces lecanii RCEF 1005]|uniref:Ricin B lectin n=1 Tax=Akanthomyces lecanii RCEF 1005 TaxID=1081108 RepID=A0A162IVW5_CORDF|nr:Ricin B lectin [Akanthomyces lecanii RCEF 1005]